MTRNQVLEKIRQAHAEFVAALTDLRDDVMATQPVVDWWTLKDVMSHVAMWERVAIQFIEDYRLKGLPASLGLKATPRSMRTTSAARRSAGTIRSRAFARNSTPRSAISSRRSSH